ncbi:MAG: hypothetical protein K9N40_04655 [Candidatus Cloacimonetes bacterium]|nr:hypothetical protein [Candidatus Cloacimonadota bacterium]
MRRISQLKTVSLALVCLLAVSFNLFAAKYYEVEPVKYLQLPNEMPNYTSAKVYIQADQSETRDTMGKGLGKLGIKTESKTLNMDELVVNIFADKVEKFTDWPLFDIPVSLADATGTLKVVVVYTPDDSARPMMAPMKNNKGNHQFSYRVAARMRIYDGQKMLLEKDFGAVTGIGEAKNWPKGGGGEVELFSFGKKSEETEKPSEKHPYTEACIEGALTHAKRVLFGLYGAREFSVPLGVYTIKSQKDSKDISKKYKKIVEGNKKVLLSSKKMKKIQDCVDFWEAIISDVKDDELWAVHYNLAIGYAWLLDSEKSNEHIHKVWEINSDRFDNIINKSGSFSGKDIAVLEAYNTAEPFAAYYAKGINNYPNIPVLMDMDIYTMSNVLMINDVIAANLDLPIPLPIFPYEVNNTGMKKCEGVVKKTGNTLLEFKYDLKKGDIKTLELKGAKDSYLKKMKEDVVITDVADLHPAEQKHLYYNFGNSKIDCHYSVTPQVEFVLSFNDYTSPHVIEPYKLEGDLNEVKTIFGNGSYQKAKLTDFNFIQSMTLHGNNWFTSEFVLGDSAHITIEAKPYTVQAEAKDITNGLPGKYEITYELQDSYVGLYAKIKSKFGETTNSKQSRRLAAQSRMQPLIDQLMKETVLANGAKIDGKNIMLTKTYECNIETDDNGNWTKIELGEYTVEREIKY